MTGTILNFPAMQDEDYSRYPNRIREIRKARGKTLEWLAIECDCTIATISDMERGRRPVRLDWLRLIGTAFNLPAGDLLSEEDNPSSLSAEERRLIDALRASDANQRRTVLAMAEAGLQYQAQPPLRRAG